MPCQWGGLYSTSITPFPGQSTDKALLQLFPILLEKWVTHICLNPRKQCRMHCFCFHLHHHVLAGEILPILKMSATPKAASPLAYSRKSLQESDLSLCRAPWNCASRRCQTLQIILPHDSGAEMLWSSTETELYLNPRLPEPHKAMVLPTTSPWH